MASSRSTAVWRQTLLIGCGGVLLLAAMMAGLLAWKWDSVTKIYRSASRTMSELQAVQTAIQSRYDTPQVVIRSMRRTGVAGPILVVELVNPPFLNGLSEDGLKEKAREVAAVARDAYLPRQSVEQYEVVISRQMGFGVTLSSAHSFRFRASELPPMAK